MTTGEAVAVKVHRFLLHLDVSMNAVQTGETAGACSAISRVIADLPEGPRTMVGIATFDSSIQFYNLKRALQQPLIVYSSRRTRCLHSASNRCYCSTFQECRQHPDLLLESIPTMFQNNKTIDSSFGAGIKAAFLGMKSTGGKLLVLS
ncbi:putative sec23/Sec24, trunk domain, von Willebrand factor A-like domain superfamily [Helianthus annuus]|nr:putative sec23/Sec24, trunk domain, von Willebrand factor A-like domain superfamily [Helianthus annuus]